MNNLRIFATYADYSAATLNYPAVSWVVSGDTVYFDKAAPVPTCEPTNPNVWVVADPSDFDFSQKVYQIDLGMARYMPDTQGVSLYLYNSPSDSTWLYKIDEVNNINPDDGTQFYDITIRDSSYQNVYNVVISEGEATDIDLCEILGSGFYLKADDVPSVEVCDQEECTEYDCLEYDEETGECIEQGDTCISSECTASHTEYPSVVV